MDSGHYASFNSPARAVQAASRALPFARRRLITLRPALDDILLRNP
jgi:hypothetical protein